MTLRSLLLLVAIGFGLAAASIGFDWGLLGLGEEDGRTYDGCMALLGVFFAASFVLPLRRDR